jgi:transposase
VEESPRRQDDVPTDWILSPSDRGARVAPLGPPIAADVTPKPLSVPRLLDRHKPKSAFRRFPPVHKANLEGQQRVDFIEKVACRADSLLIQFSQRIGGSRYDGRAAVMQEALFYGFSLERHVPSDHLVRRIDRFVDLSEVRAHLEPYYSEVGRPSIDPELMIRMLIVGYCFGVRSERRLCEEVHLNLAYRWFCRLGLDSEVLDHSSFSKNRHGRFRESDLLRKLFKTVVARCMKERLVGGEAFAVDASMIVADAHRRRGVAKIEDLDPTSSRAVAEYLSVLDDAAFGGASPSEPKAISPVDPAARYTAAANTASVYAYSDNLRRKISANTQVWISS